VLTNREHIIALKPLEKGLVGTLLRYPYEVRSEERHFDEIPDVKVTKDMLEVRGPVRDGADRSHQPEARRQANHSEGPARRQRRRPDEGAAPERRPGRTGEGREDDAAAADSRNRSEWLRGPN
jgi:DNA end-binding protein Ku